MEGLEVAAVPSAGWRKDEVADHRQWWSGVCHAPCANQFTGGRERVGGITEVLPDPGEPTSLQRVRLLAHVTLAPASTAASRRPVHHLEP